VDVRVVSATNKDLREEVRAGRFREDLLYRLNVVSLAVPSLRERPEDLPLLAEYFLSRKARASQPKKLSPGALALLHAYDWPGNVRELEHVLEGALLLSSGEFIEEADLSIHTHVHSRPPGTEAAAPSETGELTLEEMERIHIERVLRANGYSRTRSAEALAISKKTLYLKIKRYGLKTAD
jgi:transcriptional regulator with PAS, ATPase and Fis domain